MKLMELPGGDTLHHYKKSLVLCFAGPRDVLSTGPIGGGFRTDLQAVFNNDCNPGAGMSCELTQFSCALFYEHTSVAFAAKLWSH